MKKLSLSILLLLVSVSVFGQTKVGYTNVELLLSFMPEMETVNKQINDLKKKLDNSIKIKEKYYVDRQTTFAEKLQNEVVTDSEKQSMQNELVKLDKEIQKAYEESDMKLQKKQSELMQPVLEKIQGAIDEVAEEEGYQYILNATTGMNIIYGAEEYNCTDQIASKLGISIPDSE